jgi:hypothetical protein
MSGAPGVRPVGSSTPAVPASKIAKRKLSRLNSNEPREIKIEDCKCISGAWMKQKLYLPIFKIAGAEVTSLTYKTSWLPLCLYGRGRTGSVPGLLAAMKKNLREQVVASLGAADAEDMQTAAAGAAACGIDDDDGEEDGEDEGSDQEGNATLKSRRVSDRLRVLQPVRLRGHEVHVLFIRSTLYVRATENDISAMLSILRTYKKAELSNNWPVKSAALELDEDEKSSVRWSFTDSSWTVKYMDDEGKHHRSSKGLKVPRFDHLGQALDLARYKEVRLAKLNQAKKMWNDLDKSDQDRFGVE